MEDDGPTGDWYEKVRERLIGGCMRGGENRGEGEGVLRSFCDISEPMSHVCRLSGFLMGGCH